MSLSNVAILKIAFWENFTNSFVHNTLFFNIRFCDKNLN